MSALDRVVGWLACPHCAASLTLTGAVAHCASGHAFDVARQGYLNLSGRHPPANADTADMVAARERFLASGHYDPISAAVSRRLGNARRVLDVGAGTGHHLAMVLDAHPDAVGLASDVSVAAARRAARRHPRMASIVADTWVGLPLRPSSVDALMCVFAPRNASEFFRVLAPGGVVIVVTPDADHLAALRRDHALLQVHPDKTADVARQLSGLTPIMTQHVGFRADLTGDEVRDLVGMGPNAFHSVAGDLAATRIDVSVDVSVFRKPAG